MKRFAFGILITLLLVAFELHPPIHELKAAFDSIPTADEIGEVINAAFDFVRPAHELNEARGSVNTVAFSGDNRWLATGAGDNNARLYSLRIKPLARHRATGFVPKLEFNFTDSSSWISALAFSNDGRWLATGSGDNRVRLYPVGFSNKSQRAPALEKLHSLVYSSDKTGPELVLQHNLTDASGAILAMTFSADSKWLATGSADSKVRLYRMQDAAAPQLAYTLADASSAIWAVAFSKDGRLVITGSGDQSVRLYSIPRRYPSWREPELKHRLSHASNSILALTITSDSRWLATGSEDSYLRLYSMRGNAAPELTYNVTGSGGWLWAVAFSQDGRCLATGSSDGRVRLYNLSGSALNLTRTFTDATSGSIIKTVAFSGDDRWLAAGSSDQRLRIYTLEGGILPYLTHHIKERGGRWIVIFVAMPLLWLFILKDCVRKKRVYTRSAGGQIIFEQRPLNMWKMHQA